MICLKTFHDSNFGHNFKDTRKNYYGKGNINLLLQVMCQGQSSLGQLKVIPKAKSQYVWLTFMAFVSPKQLLFHPGEDLLLYHDFESLTEMIT